jgi:hypothetical protein
MHCFHRNLSVIAKQPDVGYRVNSAAEDCNYQIVKNLRNWFIAIPKATANASIAETNDIDDKDIAPANPTVCQS